MQNSSEQTVCSEGTRIVNTSKHYGPMLHALRQHVKECTHCSSTAAQLHVIEAFNTHTKVKTPLVRAIVARHASAVLA